jgi:hypothetical protein
VVMASVPMPQPAPQPKEGEAPQPQATKSAGLFGNLFGGWQTAKTESTAPTAPAAESETVALRGTNTDMAAKPKRAAPMRTASAPVMLHPRRHEAAPHKRREAVAVVNNAPASAPAKPAPAAPVQQARDEPKTPAPVPEMRSAYSAPRPANKDLLSGAQPVVPASSFEARWAALR